VAFEALEIGRTWVGGELDEGSADEPLIFRNEPRELSLDASGDVDGPGWC